MSGVPIFIIVILCVVCCSAVIMIVYSTNLAQLCCGVAMIGVAVVGAYHAAEIAEKDTHQKGETWCVSYDESGKVTGVDVK